MAKNDKLLTLREGLREYSAENSIAGLGGEAAMVRRGLDTPAI